MGNIDDDDAMFLGKLRQRGKLTEQELMVESDKLINQQWDRTYITAVTDFAVIYEKARVVVQSDWV